MVLAYIREWSEYERLGGGGGFLLFFITDRLRLKGPMDPAFFQASCWLLPFSCTGLKGVLWAPGLSLTTGGPSVSSAWLVLLATRGVLLLEMVEESETSVSDDPEQLQPEDSERVAVRWVEAREEIREDITDGAREENREDARDEALDGAGLADARLLLLTMRTLLRLLLRLSSTTSTDGGSTAFGMILDMYVASGETYITGLDGEVPDVVIQGLACEFGHSGSNDWCNRCRSREVSSCCPSCGGSCG